MLEAPEVFQRHALGGHLFRLIGEDLPSVTLDEQGDLPVHEIPGGAELFPAAFRRPFEERRTVVLLDRKMPWVGRKTSQREPFV